MNQELVGKLVAEFKTTTRKQRRNQLGSRDGSGCAYAVVSDLYERETGETLEWDSTNDPKKIHKWLGLKRWICIADKSLVEWNDDERLSFREIGELIEKHGIRSA